MPREITDGEGITWTCIQAFAGLGNDPEKAEAARVEGSEDKVRVVCTPSGAARSVRIECTADWEASMQDEQLLGVIQEGLAEAEQATWHQVIFVRAMRALSARFFARPFFGSL